jgi:hypothetical protein
VKRPFYEAPLCALLVVGACREPSTQPDPDASAAVRSATPATPVIASVPTPPATADAGRDLIEAADLEHVEPLDVLSQAQAIARRFDEHAELTEIYVRPTVDGSVNVLANADLVYTFEFNYRDPESPPGQGQRVGKIAVLSEGKELGAISLGPRHVAPTRRGPTVRCTLKQAWARAVAGGVPRDAAITAEYATRDAAWSLRVNGHPEWSRVVGLRACAADARSPVPVRRGDAQ